MTYIKKWPLGLFAGRTSVLTPFPALTSVADDEWKPWKGKWKDGSQVYELEEEDGAPVFSSNGSTFIKLLPAALPSSSESGDGPAFILEGFDLVARLKMEKDERVIILGSELLGDTQTLKLDSV
jgi:hypothetical protein